MKRGLWLLLYTSLAPIPAFASEVRISLSQPISYGEAVRLSVEVVNPESGVGQPQLGPLESFEVRGPAGPSRQFTSVQGRTRNAFVYEYLITPSSGRTGTFNIGPVTVARRGKEPLVSNVVQLRVFRRPEPGVLIRCELSAPRGRIGEPFRVTYKVCFPSQPAERRRDSFEFGFDRNDLPLQALSFPLLKQAGVFATSAVAYPDQPPSSLRLEGQLIHFQESFLVVDGAGYQALLFAFDVLPLRAGPIDAGKATASMRLQTGQVAVRRDILFGDTHVAEVKTFTGEGESVVYEVDPLPAEGRPPGFTGAIGRYAISVETADTEVDAFAPVRLMIRVSSRLPEGIGAANAERFLGELQPPSWGEIEALRRDFDVAGDVDSGRVEGGAKLFQQTIRPRSEKVAQIPPIPFPYYDPWLKKYVVARSEPIAIKVRAVKTVGGDDAILSPRSASVPGPAPAPSPAPILEQKGVASNFREIGPLAPSLDPRRSLWRLPFLLALAVPPAFFLALALALKLAERDPARVASQRAFSRARAALAAAEDEEAVSRACQDYFRERFQLPPGELTPAQLEIEMERRRIDPAAAGRARELLERLLACRFGGGGASARELAASSLEVLREIERASGSAPRVPHMPLR
jgi:hypothetical protein